MNELWTKVQHQITWQIPGEKEEYAGVFEFDPIEKCCLTTSAGWDIKDMQKFWNHKAIDIILGSDNSGIQWTFIDCVISRLGTDRIVLIVNYALRGKHFRTTSGIFFQSATIQFPFLDSWLGRRPFENVHGVSGIEGMRFNAPEAIVAELPTADIFLLLNGRINAEHKKAPPSYSIQYDSEVNISP